jgi:inosose dehydratase
MTKTKKAYQTNCWGPLGGNGVGVTSITQLTYRTFGDMEKAIAEIGAVGYDGVELFDGNLMDYEGREKAFKRVLNDAGVKLVGVYSGANFIFDDILREELARIERVAAMAGELGALHLVVGGGAKRAKGSERDDIKHLGAGLDKVGRIASKHGLRAHFHPHLTTIVETDDEVRRVFEETSIDFCPDTAHLAAAGSNVPMLIRALRKRITYVHLKGWRRRPFAFTPLDEGDLDVMAIIDVLKETRFDGWVLAELDSWPNPKAGAARSLRFMNRAGL